MIASLEGFQDVGEILIQHGANMDLQSQVSVKVLYVNIIMYYALYQHRMVTLH